MTATILCVEDETDLRRDIVEELHDAGYETLEAENGKVALDTILNQKPDLVICDITMPVMDGHTLLSELRSNHPERSELPFLFLTALADRDNLVKGKKLGADDYLTKPVDYELLLAAVESRLTQFDRARKRQQEQLIKVYKAAVEEVSGSSPDPAKAETSTPPGNATNHDAELRPASDGHDIAQHLRDRVTATPTKIVAGRVQILGLTEFKQAFGDRWQRHGEMVIDLIEQTITKRLAAADVFQQDVNGDFTICFSELSASEAAFKVRAIADEVRAKILGKEFTQGEIELSADASAFLDEVAGTSGNQPFLSFKGDAHEIELAVQEVEEQEDLLALLRARLEAAAERAKTVESTILKEIANHSTLKLQRIGSHSGGDTPFHFADFDQDTQGKIEALRSHRPASEELLRDIDVLLVTKVAEEIFQRPPGKNVILIANVHFSTLDNKRRLEDFKSICETLTEPARTSLVLNVIEIPPSLLPAKVAEHFFSVRHFCRAMMAQCSAPKLGNLDPQMLRTPILTFKAWDLINFLAKDRGAVTTFINQLKRNKVRLLAYRINSDWEEEQIRNLGIEFLSYA
jgi:CheY-like chemotaxis protein